MKKSTNLGILLFVIGLSFLAGTIYRGYITHSFGTESLFGLDAETWTGKPFTNYSATHFLTPRDHRIQVLANSTIDIYLIDNEGMTLWSTEGKLNPVWEAKGVTQDVFSVHISRRGFYGLLIYNPKESMVDYEIHVTVYGYEQDLIWITIVFISVGLVTIVAGQLINHYKQKVT